MSPKVIGCPSCKARNRLPASVSGRPRCASCKADLPWIVDATDATLAEALKTPALVLVDLWAPWCGPCRMVAPVLERLASRYAGTLKIVKINVDDNPVASRRFDARSIPTLAVVHGGEEIDRVIGAQPEPALAALVEKYGSLTA